MKIDKTQGYIKLWRCFMDERIFANKDLWHIWTWLLIKARHNGSKWFLINKGSGQIEVEVEPGQLVLGRISAGRELGEKPTTVWSRLQKLKKLGFIDIQSDKNKSIITICNYEEMFASAESKMTSAMEGTHKDRSKNGERTNKDPDTDKNVKNVKNVKKEPLKPASQVPDVFKYFSDKCELKKGFKPAINGGKDGKLIKAFLVKASLLDAERLIDWFLINQESDRLSPSVSVCFSAHILNKWKSDTNTLNGSGIKSDGLYPWQRPLAGRS